MFIKTLFAPVVEVKPQPILQQQPAEPIDINDLDVPTFLRKQQENQN